MEMTLNNSFLAIENDELNLVNGGSGLSDSSFWGSLADWASCFLNKNTFIGFFDTPYL